MALSLILDIVDARSLEFWLSDLNFLNLRWTSASLFQMFVSIMNVCNAPYLEEYQSEIKSQKRTG